MKIDEITRPTRTRDRTKLSIPDAPTGQLTGGRPSQVAAAGRTRNAVAQAHAGLSPEARAMAANIRDPGVHDEISDEEAARRAGRQPGYPEPPRRRPPPTTLPAVISHDLVVQGGPQLDWHAIKSTPGYMRNLFRMILRQAFRAFPNAPELEEIYFVSPSTNPPADVMKLAKWISVKGRLLQDAEFKLDEIVPGYTAQTKFYQVGDEQYLITKDIAGIAVMVWPAKDEGALPDQTGRLALPPVQEGLRDWFDKSYIRALTGFKDIGEVNGKRTLEHPNGTRFAGNDDGTVTFYLPNGAIVNRPDVQSAINFMKQLKTGIISRFPDSP